MSQNEHKRSTGYYTLKIIGTTGVDAKLKDLYVKVVVKGTAQRTGVIQTASGAWNETLPIRVPMGKTIVSFTLLRRLMSSSVSRPIAARNITVSDLVELCSGKEEARLMLTDSGRLPSQGLVIALSFSDVRENARAALGNLLDLIDDDGNIPLDLKSDALVDKVEQVTKQGKTLMQSSSAKSIRKGIPAVDIIVDTVDNVVQAHPLLNVGWQLVAAVYKIASEQIKLDKRISGLLQSIAFAFSFAQDASLLSEGDDRLTSLRRTIIQLLDQLIECSLFIREYARHSFFKRMTSQAYDKQKVKSIEDALKTLQENLRTGVEVSGVIIGRDMRDAVQLRAKDDVLKEIRLAFGLTLIMLHEMESSSHQQCLESTRTTWITELVAWAKSDSVQNVLWINGIPGSGKSTIAQTIARHEDILFMLISHIFFKRESTSRHNILLLIAYRLAERNVKIAEEIAVRAHRLTLTLRDTFVNLILEPLKAAESAGLLDEPIIIILDALDEYGTSESRAQFMELLGSDFADLPRCVRFLVTSRPEADLVHALSSKDHIHERVLDVHTEESKRDVSTYIETEMKKLVPPKSSSGTKWNEMMLTFGQAADGLFIWASVVIRLVKNAQRPYKKICALASNESRLTLDDLYRQALEAVDVNWDDPDVRELFAILFALILPNRGALTIELFDSLLGFEGDSSELFLSKLQSFISSRKFILVQIHHKTFADYLQSPARVPREPWYISMSRQNSLIVRQCFTAMKELHFDMCGAVTRPEDNEVAIGDIQPHILYSCLFWADHLKGADFSADLLKCLNSFLSERLLFWFEVLSHLKELSRVASQALLRATDWISTHSPISSTLLVNASSIVSRFPNLMQTSPAFIYTTALPLTAKSNHVSGQYVGLLKEVMQISELHSDVAPEEAHLGGVAGPFAGHTEMVSSVVFSPDMRYILSSSYDSTIRVWNARTSESVVAPFTGHSGSVYCIAVSPEGRMIASASEDGTVRLWDAETGSAIGEPLQGHEGAVQSVAFSPTEQRIASGGGDGTVRLWDTETGKAVGKPFTGHGSWVLSVAYSPDGRQVVSGSDDKTIRIWDATTGAPVGEPLRGHDDGVWSVAFSPDGRRVASGSSDETVRIWDVLTGAPIGNQLVGHGAWVGAVAFSPDGSRLVSASGDATVRIWNTETCEAVGEPLGGHDGMMCSVAYSRDGSRIVSGGENGHIIVWDALTGKPIIGTGIEPKDALRTIADDGSNLAIADCQLFAGWKMEDGWLVGASGERRLWFPGYMRKLVKQVEEGLYVHEDLDLKNCNGAVEEHRGFVIS